MLSLWLTWKFVDRTQSLQRAKKLERHKFLSVLPLISNRGVESNPSDERKCCALK